jgi:hypothetical protein
MLMNYVVIENVETFAAYALGLGEFLIDDERSLVLMVNILIEHFRFDTGHKAPYARCQ